MGDKDLLSEAYSYLRISLPLMSKYEIPATPRNYTVWFHYVSGSDSELNKVIDTMRDKGEAFTEEKNEALYHRFFGEKDENELRKIREDLQEILAIVLSEVTELTGQTEEYESFISNSINILSENASTDEIRAVIGTIIDKTKTLGQHGKTMRHKLTETTDTLETLKKDFEQVKTEALVDFLTGAPNRKAFDETLTKVTGETTSDNTDLSLLMIDIDHFKRFNDEQGHLIGDEVLRFVAKRIKELVRGRDFLARFGGEEFALILPETPMAGATVVAESIRSFFAQATLKEVATSKKLGKITVSIGVACYRPGEPTKEFINRSDQALYFAKNNGRNCAATESELISGST
jgi:diguanylate cyclase